MEARSAVEGRQCTLSDMEARYPLLDFDLDRDAFAVWVRWVSMEQPPSPEDPPGQGVRVELSLDRNPVLGPTIVYRKDLETPVAMLAHRVRVGEVLRASEARGRFDLQLTIHGSVANAPWAAVYLLRDFEGEHIFAAPLRASRPSLRGRSRRRRCRPRCG